MDNDSDIDRLVAARLDRQTILASENPPVLWYVIDEAVLPPETPVCWPRGRADIKVRRG